MDVSTYLGDVTVTIFVKLRKCFCDFVLCNVTLRLQGRRQEICRKRVRILEQLTCRSFRRIPCRTCIENFPSVIHILDNGTKISQKVSIVVRHKTYDTYNTIEDGFDFFFRVFRLEERLLKLVKGDCTIVPCIEF